MRGFRLNGWQRIGIVLSVIWLPVGAWLAVKFLHDPVWEGYRICQSLVFSGIGNQDECGRWLDTGLANAEAQSALFFDAAAPAP
jgi:hypothetical protein